MVPPNFNTFLEKVHDEGGISKHRVSYTYDNFIGFYDKVVLIIGNVGKHIDFEEFSLSSLSTMWIRIRGLKCLPTWKFDACGLVLPGNMFIEIDKRLTYLMMINLKYVLQGSDVIMLDIYGETCC